jgi:hypothetical protein
MPPAGRRLEGAGPGQGSQRGKRARWRALLARLPPLERALRRLRRHDEVAALQAEVAALRSQPAAGVRPFLTWVEPGHFYSPVPDLVDIEAQADRIFARRRDLPGIRIREREQLALFSDLARLARDVPLPGAPGGRFRLDEENVNFGIGDALVLQSMLRHLRPRRYLEVGSGWTTALALDTNERYLGGSMAITAVEPHPELLRTLVRGSDRLEVVESPAQSVPVATFGALGDGDVLFIDCSHVLKTGSDVQFLYTDVLPALGEGVYVHLHDMFWPFEYLRHWVEEGRAWNELYLVHAFLAFNEAFEIVLFNSWLAAEHPGVIERELPAMAANPGGSLWLRRVPGPR